MSVGQKDPSHSAALSQSGTGSASPTQNGHRSSNASLSDKGRLRLQALGSSNSMGSGRSTPCCHVSPEELKGSNTTYRDGITSEESSGLSTQSPGSPDLSMKAEVSVKGSPSMKGISPKAGEGLAGAAEAGTKSMDMSPKSGKPVQSGGTSSIAARRGFQPTLAAGTKGGAPLSISTKKEQPKRKEKRRIKAVDSIHNHYKVGETVMPSSHSGMSVVFAKRVEDGMEVVIKVRAKANSFVDRAEEREWRHNTEFMLNLPETEGIAKLYEVLEDRKGYYVIMEKVAGQDLFETMTGKGLLPVAEVKEVIKQLLQALAELHARNCIHKDLKLENVMFDRTPPANAKADWDTLSGNQSPVKVKLIDFDTVETVQPQTPKKAKDVLGTDQYIAQEAYDGNYSAASDIFAVGVIGYRLLTAKFPYRAEIFDDEAGDNWVGSPKMKEIRQKLQNYKIDWNHRIFSLEPQACALIKAMLNSNERERPTAKEALANTWFNETQRRRSLPNLEGDRSPANGSAAPASVIKMTSEG